MECKSNPYYVRHPHFEKGDLSSTACADSMLCLTAFVKTVQSDSVNIPDHARNDCAFESEVYSGRRSAALDISDVNVYGNPLNT